MAYSEKCGPHILIFRMPIPVFPKNKIRPTTLIFAFQKYNICYASKLINSSNVMNHSVIHR